jgi:hypothetical protein
LNQVCVQPPELEPPLIAAPPEELDEDEAPSGEADAGEEGLLADGEAGLFAVFAGGASFLLHATKPPPRATIPRASATFFNMSIAFLHENGTYAGAGKSSQTERRHAVASLLRIPRPSPN